MKPQNRVYLTPEVSVTVVKLLAGHRSLMLTGVEEPEVEAADEEAAGAVADEAAAEELFEDAVVVAAGDWLLTVARLRTTAPIRVVSRVAVLANPPGLAFFNQHWPAPTPLAGPLTYEKLVQPFVLAHMAKQPVQSVVMLFCAKAEPEVPPPHMYNQAFPLGSFKA